MNARLIGEVRTMTALTSQSLASIEQRIDAKDAEIATLTQALAEALDKIRALERKEGHIQSLERRLRDPQTLGDALDFWDKLQRNLTLALHACCERKIHTVWTYSDCASRLVAAELRIRASEAIAERRGDYRERPETDGEHGSIASEGVGEFS